MRGSRGKGKVGEGSRWIVKGEFGIIRGKVGGIGVIQGDYGG